MAKTILMTFLKVGEFAVVMATTTKNAKLILSILDTWHENNSFQVSTPEKEQQLPDVRNNKLQLPASIAITFYRY
jgi:hypothetical protein